jgi:hypothetical protein
MRTIDDPQIFCESVSKSIKSIFQEIDDQKMSSRLKFHNELQIRVKKLAHEYGLRGQTEFEARHREASWGSIDVAWLLNSNAYAIFEIDSAFRIKSIWKLDAVDSAFKFWVYYGKLDAQRERNLLALEREYSIEVIKIGDNKKTDKPLKNSKVENIENLHRKREKPKLLDSVYRTYDLYLQNYSIEKIAEIRGLKTSTIVIHLRQLLWNGIKIDINRWIPEEKQKEIFTVFNERKYQDFRDVKNALGGEYSYDEISLALAYQNALLTKKIE